MLGIHRAERSTTADFKSAPLLSLAPWMLADGAPEDVQDMNAKPMPPFARSIAAQPFCCCHNCVSDTLAAESRLARRSNRGAYTAFKYIVKDMRGGKHQQIPVRRSCSRS